MGKIVIIDKWYKHLCKIFKICVTFLGLIREINKVAIKNQYTEIYRFSNKKGSEIITF